MKKYILSLSGISLIAIASIFTSCKKINNTPPTITLTGTSSITISLQGHYIELGASAADNAGTGVAAIITGTVNVNLTGTYIITYTATDNAGNTSKIYRTVTVVNALAVMAGNYTCTITSASPPVQYTQTITASATQNKRIGFGYFNDFVGNTSIFADVFTNTTVSLPNQTGYPVGSPAVVKTFGGSGTITSDSTFTLNYTVTTNGTPVNTVETFMKQ